MNAYVYAPKDDPKHRAEWRSAYTPEERREFARLAAHAADHGVRFGFACSPGLDITYESPGDRAALVAKFAPLRDAGVDWFLLLVDDIPMRPGLATRQADLARALADELADAALTLCPTEYVGTHPSPYLSDLASELPPDIDLMWTGPTVCSPTITADDARGWTKAVGDHRVLLWDNYPVNDALMTSSLHLGPYVGRDADLADLLGGVLCNPMTQAHGSLVALATAMEFLTDVDAYDPHAAWDDAIDAVGGPRAEPLRVLARACADSPLSPPEAVPLAAAVDAVAAALGGPDWVAPLAAAATELRAARALTDAFAAESDDPLAAEVAPWALAARAEAEAGLAALRCIQQCRPVATLGDAAPAPVAVDPELALQHTFVLLYLWSAARADEKVVYGPRFAVYTPVIQLADGAPALDAAAAVREDGNAVDRLCRLALRTYDEWRTDASTAAAEVDGAIVRQGSLATRVDAATSLPFADARLA